MRKDFFFERTDALIDSPLNERFDEIQRMSDEQFDNWAISLRREVARLWRDEGIPPIRGFTIEEVISQFNALRRVEVANLFTTDELTGRRDCILFNSTLGSACKAFFSNMGKTKDLASGNESLWDYFTNDRFRDKFLSKTRRHFRGDGFHRFSLIEQIGTSGREWIENWATYRDDPGDIMSDWDFRLEAVGKSRTRGTRKLKPITITKAELEELKRSGILAERYFENIDCTKLASHASYESADAHQQFVIRSFPKGERVFPEGFRFFQAGLVLGATNFPPVIAKFIHRHFTDDIKDQDRIVIYDPSAGFGGRLLGALSAGSDRQMHYVGTDPNPDNWDEGTSFSRYDRMADFYRRNVNQTFHTTTELFKLGSEVIARDRRFKEYRGEVDLVFTSPPYFAAEGYSDDAHQSNVKFPVYEDWRDGFLRPTLETAVKWLKPGRPLIWNIADTKIRGRYVPLEHDSRAILESLGMHYEGKLKMVLARSPGANRFDKAGMPETKNFCMIDGKYRKYESVFVFRKPH